MKGPARWRDDQDSPDDVRAMLSAAKKTRPMTGQDRARLGKRIGRAALAPTGIALGLWSKAVLAAAGVGAASWVAVAAVRKIVRHDDSAITASSRGPAPRSSRSASGRTSPRAAVDAPNTPPNTVPNTPPNTTTAPVPSVAITTSAPLATQGPIPQPPLPRLQPTHARRIDHRPLATALAPLASVAASASRPASPAPTSEAPGTSVASNESTPPLLREAQLVERARVALASDPAIALARATEADEAFPSGALRSERDVVAIDALVRLGQRDRARERARRALQRDPQSAYAARWRAVLESVEPR